MTTTVEGLPQVQQAGPLPHPRETFYITTVDGDLLHHTFENSIS
jgi:hypothetical protein